jgi:hypothetical protein
MSKYIWTDKQGKKYTEKDITDSHLVNIIKFLDAKSNDLSYPCFNGEMAQYYAEQSFEAESGAITNAIWFFRRMAEKRKLKVNC